MVKFEWDNNQSELVRNLVDDALLPKSGDINEPLDEHENLVYETRRLKDNLAARRRETAQGNKFETNMYGAGYYLANALEFILDQTADVSHIDPETAQITADSGNVAREMFVNSIKRALNHLGMDGDTVKAILLESQDG